MVKHVCLILSLLTWTETLQAELATRLSRTNIDELESVQLTIRASGTRSVEELDLSELEENEFNLNVPRYVDISEPEEPIDIQEAYDELSGLESEQKVLEKKVKDDLKELGIKL